MKKGYVRLFLYQFVIMLILLLNSFIPSILSDYKIVIFLIILILLFKLIFGFEKDRNRYIKDIIIDIIIVFLISLIIYYLSGLIIGFTKTTNYRTWFGLKNFIIPIILTITLKEFLRYNMVKKTEGSKLLFFSTCVMFIALDVSGSFQLKYFSTSYNVFLFIALYILPSISHNVVCTYIAGKVGYKPNILFLLFDRLYYYIIPIVPATGEYIESLIGLLFPLIIFYRVYTFFLKDTDAPLERKNKKASYIALAGLLLFTSFLVYFTSGFFHYYAVSIGSGSMTPEINVGDAVIIEKIDENYEFQVGQIIAYEYHNVIIVHRINKIENDDNEYFYYTKGDANKDTDAFPVKREMIIGIVNNKIPYIGLPAVWLNNL